MNKKSITMIILAGILWGTSCIFVKLWEQMRLSAAEMTTLRTIAAFLCFLIFVLIFDRGALKTNIRDALLYAGSGVTLFGTAAFYYKAMQLTSVSTAVVLMYMSPVLVLGWSVAFFGERLTVKKALAVVCMLTGSALVSGIAGGACFNPKGTVMGILSAVSYGAYSIFTKIQARRGCSSVTSTVFSFFFAALASACACNFSVIGEVFTEYPSKTILLAIIHGIMTFVLPYFLYSLSMKKLPAGVAASMGVVEPLSGTLFSVALLGETLTVIPACGIVLILGAVIVLGRGNG